MSPEVSEPAVEEAIECASLQHGPGARPGQAAAVRESAPPYGGRRTTTARRAPQRHRGLGR